VVQGLLLCYFDSTHFQHGETVTFRIYAKTPEDEDWVLEATTTRQVVNGFVVVVDTAATPANTYAMAAMRFLDAGYGELPGLNSPGWTKPDYLNKLPPMQVHTVFTHGNPGGLIPPGGGGTIFAADVRGAVPGPEPKTMQAYVGACSAGSSEAFLKSYLREGEPDTTNRFVTGFKKAVAWQQAEIFFRSVVGIQANSGYSVGEAVDLARGIMDDPNSVRTFGDPNARIKWLFDGQPGVKTGIWKHAP
jgi:hypothetical protein